MIDPDKRKAIYLLHQEGMGLKQIARRLAVSKNTVRSIIAQRGIMPASSRADKIIIDEQLLFRLYNDCSGRVQRIHEKLTEEENICIGYSTLTRKIQQLGIGPAKNKRCGKVPDEAGQEMQHDTTVYWLMVAKRRVKVVGSLIYLRYCKLRYLKFYRSFNRFAMKCFLHEALVFWGYCAPICIIDNTNLARLRGTGKNAVICPEMEQFARQYGFEFICHEKGHANRKAGNERSFYTVETNFFPGRTFDSLEDLNRQALDWATVRMANRPVSKTGLIPAQAFEYEKPYLTRLPEFVSAPYLGYTRGTDQYGYISVDGNFYWVPGTSRHEVKVLQYSQSIKIYQHRNMLACYPLPPDGTKNKAFSPEGEPKPKQQPKDRKKPATYEEENLRAMSPEIGAYLDFLKNQKGIQKNRFIRALYGLCQKISPGLFNHTASRALKYRITDMGTVERIAVLLMKDLDYDMPFAPIDENLSARASYLEGCFTDRADLSVYDQEKDDE